MDGFREMGKIKLILKFDLSILNKNKNILMSKKIEIIIKNFLFFFLKKNQTHKPKIENVVLIAATNKE
jgi:hypothetical protein